MVHQKTKRKQKDQRGREKESKKKGGKKNQVAGLRRAASLRESSSSADADAAEDDPSACGAACLMMPRSANCSPNLRSCSAATCCIRELTSSSGVDMAVLEAMA